MTLENVEEIAATAIYALDCVLWKGGEMKRESEWKKNINIVQKPIPYCANSLENQSSDIRIRIQFSLEFVLVPKHFWSG